METLKVLGIIFWIILTVASLYLNRLYHKQEEKLLRQIDELSFIHLTALLQECIEREDYETAQRCKDLLSKFS
jgi:protein-arginine kinase activator protein McsA